MFGKIRTFLNANPGVTLLPAMAIEIVVAVVAIINDNKVTSEKVKAAQLEQEYHKKQIEFLAEGT